MGIVNGIMNELGDLLIALFGWMHPVLTILVLSVLVGAASLLVFKWTSDQEKIRASKGPMKAHLLGILLFRHDLRQVFRALGLALLRSLLNLRFMLVPMGVMIVPLILVFVQLEMRYGYRPFEPGDRVVVRVHVKEGESLDDVALEPGAGVVVETPGVRVAAGELREVDFRIRVTDAGLTAVTARAGGTGVVKTIAARPGLSAISPIRPDSGLLSRAFYPVEPPVPDEGPIHSVELRHEAATIPFLGIDWAWWVLFLVFMILALFVLKSPLGVDF